MPRAKWTTPRQIALRVREELKNWCMRRKDADGDLLLSPECFQLDLTDPNIREALGDVFTTAFGDIGFRREMTMIRLVEKVAVAVRDGRWESGEPVTLDGVREAFAWIWEIDNLDSLDVEADEL